MHPLVDLAKLEQHFAKSGKCVLMVGIEDERFLETAACPCKFLAGKTRITDTNVQFDCVRVEREPLAQYVERLIVLRLVIKGVGALIILLGTQERSRHLVSILRSGRVTGKYRALRVVLNKLQMQESASEFLHAGENSSPGQP